MRANTSINIENLTEEHLSKAFQIYSEKCGCKKEYKFFGISLNSVREMLKQGYAEFRVGSFLNSQSKFIINKYYDPSSNIWYADFSYDPNFIPESAEAIKIKKDFDSAIRNHFLGN